MKREKSIKLARAATAGLVLVAATALATPGWGHEQGKDQEQRQVQRQERRQERERRHEAGRERGRGDLGPAVKVARMIGRELHLSREQQKALREIVRHRGDELRGVAHDVGEARRALREKVLAETFDEAAIRSASEHLGATIGAAAVLTARLADEARPILTPAQRERLQKMRARWEERRERKSGHRRWHNRGRDRIEVWEGN